mmetsp:Transcript_3660/g.7905  ORF Transcript_3660/g.7905 Transcript_3660/m.7905 type:complete len:556 (-) Transcript_3660:239-1906(-)
MYLMPLLSTLLSSVFAGFMVSRGLGHRGTAVFSILSLVIAFLSSAIIWIEVVLGSCEVWIDLFGSWFEVGTVQVSWSLYYDLLTAHMLFTVTSVSLAVHIYAVVYMRSDPHLTLFMSYLSLFTFFMLVLVTGDNLILMLVGWEGIGVCSYLLIGYWSHRLAAVKSAQKAILVNRVSDGLLLWGILWVWHHTGCLEYDLVLLNAAPASSSFLSIALLIGAMGKSAQILFHVWLADAMEGYKNVLLLLYFIFMVICVGLSCSFFLSLLDCCLDTVMFCVPFLKPFLPCATLKPQDFLPFALSAKGCRDGCYTTVLQCHMFCTSVKVNQLPSTGDFPYSYGSEAMQVLVGSMLADGHLEISSDGLKGRYSQSCKYSLPLEILSDYWMPHAFNPGKPTGYPSSDPTQYWRGSKMFIYLAELWALWYIVGLSTERGKRFIKVLPRQLICDHWTPLTLAIWFMQDGYFEKYGKTFLFCTEALTLSEVKFLIERLAVFGIRAGSKKRGNGYRIRVSSLSAAAFALLVSPYVYSTYRYKLGNFPVHPCQKMQHKQHSYKKAKK